MKILICLIWMNIMTQVPIIGKNLIFKEYPKVKRKRGNSNNVNNTSTTMEATTSTTESTTVTIPLPKNVSRILLEGPKEEIPLVPLEQLVEAIKLLKGINIIPESHIVEVWQMVKGNKPRESLTVQDLDKLSGFLDKIPDHDLFYFNMSDWDLIEYLGKVKEFEKREVSILSASLIKEHGFQILRNHSCINRMYGIICGFDTLLITKIPDAEFLRIHQEIFANLHPCSRSEKRVFLVKATKPTIFGPTQVWDARTLGKANMLICAMTTREICAIRPPAMKGMKAFVLKILRMELIMALNSKQIAYLSTRSYLVYKERIRISSNQLCLMSYFSSNILFIVSFLIYLKER